jgi:hypothetical protein
MESSNSEISTPERSVLAVVLTVIWAASSAFLGFVSIFSVNKTTIVLCGVAALICLGAWIALLVKRRILMAFAFAAAPGFLPFVLFKVVSLLGG